MPKAKEVPKALAEKKNEKELVKLPQKQNVEHTEIVPSKNLLFKFC